MQKLTKFLLAGLFVFEGLMMTGTVAAKNIQVCFTQNGQCLKRVVSTIDHADKTIQLQAYELTSPVIVSALTKAKQRGVDVQVLLDKENVFNNKTVLMNLKKANIAYLVDAKPDAAFSNVVIVDDQEVVTGTANFIDPKNLKVTDDIVFISDAPSVINQYIDNFTQRKKASETVENFCKHSTQCKFSQAAGSAKKAASDAWSGTKNFWKKHVNGE